MGMDTIEIVMAIEKEFQIKIPDDAAANLVTVGMLSDYVVSVTRQRAPNQDQSTIETQILDSIIKITGEVLGIDTSLINSSSNFVYDLGAD